MGIYPSGKIKIKNKKKKSRTEMSGGDTAEFFFSFWTFSRRRSWRRKVILDSSSYMALPS